ncbi:MAG: type IV pilus modification protein PilV [Alcanivorax sp.]|nr:type IV pilus modification protein PilV [Alcanivorax sp.]
MLKSGQLAGSRGFSLIEVLIALLLLSIGLLGVAGLQALSVQMNVSANQSSQATYIGYDIVDRMRANRMAALKGAYDRALSCTLPTGTTVADNDLKEVLQRTCGMDDGTNKVPGALAQEAGKTGVQIGVASGVATVVIAWYDARWEKDPAKNSPIRKVTVQAEL